MTIGEMLKVCSIAFGDFTTVATTDRTSYFDCNSSHFPKFFPISPSRSQPDNNNEGEGNRVRHGGDNGDGHDDGNLDGAGPRHGDSCDDNGSDGDGDDDGDSSNDDVDATL